MRYQIKNKSTNHTGLAGTNLLLKNYWTMIKYNLRTDHSLAGPYYPYSDWHYVRQALKAFFTGWFHKQGIINCRIERKHETI